MFHSDHFKFYIFTTYLDNIYVLFISNNKNNKAF